MGRDEPGYCGIRKGTADSYRRDGRERALVSYYYDPIPTNCVADWVCPGGTGAGFPIYAHDRGPEAGFYNLAVFFEACNLNCLYCQNWTFKESLGARPHSSWLSVDDLAGAVNRQTSCICFFGGDPIPQLPYALRVAEQARRNYPERILRICWETNGGMHPAWLKRIARISMESGGCIKMDLKAWRPNIHRALCGFDNRLILENFALLASFAPLRPDPPLVVASTLLTPGYVNEEEIWGLASFIAGINPDIPYVLLAFAPQFRMEDFPTTSREQVDACLDAARKAGLRRVRLGNGHLVG
jgi:pyruvate formate lyase activating enzyme